jgi:hypothetical protein
MQCSIEHGPGKARFLGRWPGQLTAALRRRNGRPPVDPRRPRSRQVGTVRRYHCARLPHGFVGNTLFADVPHIHDVDAVITYGINKVRFPAPVPVGAKVRAGLTLVSLTSGAPENGRGGLRAEVRDGGHGPTAVRCRAGVLVPMTASTRSRIVNSPTSLAVSIFRELGGVDPGTGPRVRKQGRAGIRAAGNLDQSSSAIAMADSAQFGVEGGTPPHYQGTKLLRTVAAPRLT